MNKILNINSLNKSRLLSLIPALWISILDICVTIFGQPVEYWNGNLNVANEGNPIGAIFMKNHVSGLFLISGLWIILIIILGYSLPRKISRIFLLFVLIAHSMAVTTWISSKYFFIASMTLFVFNAILYITIDEYNLTREKKNCP